MRVLALAALALLLAAPAEAQRGSRTITIRGIGGVDFGMTPTQAQAAWGARWSSSDTEGVTDAPVDDARLEPGCHYTGPTGADDVRFIVEDGRVLAVETSDPRYATPSGVRVGSTLAEVRRAYPGRLTTELGVYSDEPELTFTPRDARDRDYRLVFLTQNGRVAAIKAGRVPTVGYIEGCL